jgi:archaellum component FlaC
MPEIQEFVLKITSDTSGLQQAQAAAQQFNQALQGTKDAAAQATASTEATGNAAKSMATTVGAALSEFQKSFELTAKQTKALETAFAQFGAVSLNSAKDLKEFQAAFKGVAESSGALIEKTAQTTAELKQLEGAFGKATAAEKEFAQAAGSGGNGGGGGGLFNALHEGAGLLRASLTEVAAGYYLVQQAIANVLTVVGDLASAINRGQDVIELTTSFQHLGGTSDDLNKLRESTQGLISDVDLLRKANEAMLTSLPKEQLQTLASLADALGDAVGKGTAKAFDELTRAVETGNARLAKYYVGVIDSTAVEKKYAEQLGVTVNELNELGKKHAISLEILERAKKAHEQLGESAATGGDKLQQLEAKIDNVKNAFGRMVNENETVKTFLTDVGNLAQNVADIFNSLNEKSIEGKDVIIKNLKSSIADHDASVAAGGIGGFIAGFDNIDAMKIRLVELNAERDKLADDEVRKTLTAELETFVPYNQELQHNRDLYVDRDKVAAASAKATAKVEREAAKEATEAWKKFEDDFKLIQGYLQQDLNALPILGTLGESDPAADALRKKFKESTDFFADILDDVFKEGSINFEEFFIQAAENIATSFGAQLLASITDSFTADTLKSLGKDLLHSLGFDSFGGEGGILGLLKGSGAGSLLGGLGIAAGAFVGYEQLSGVKNAANGGKLSAGEQTALALPTFGLSFAYNYSGLPGQFGGSQDPDVLNRRAIRGRLQETGLGEDLSFRGVNGRSTLFGKDNFNVDFSNPLAGQAVGLANPLAQAFAGGSGKGASDLAGIFTSATSNAKNFNEVIVNTQALMDKLGTNAEETKDAITQLFLDGKISLGEFTADVANLNLVAQNDLTGPNSVSDAIDILGKNLGEDGSPRVALKGLQLAFKEMADQGIDTSEEIHEYITANFGPDIARVFDEIQAAGLNSFEAIGNATPDQLALIFNALDPIKGAFADTADSANELGDAGEDATDRTSSGLDRVSRSAENAKKSIDKTTDSLRKLNEASAGLEGVA